VVVIIIRIHYGEHVYIKFYFKVGKMASHTWDMLTVTLASEPFSSATTFGYFKKFEEIQMSTPRSR
jgi:hypothetical protein